VLDTVQKQFMKRLLMRLIGYSGKGLGNIVGIAFRYLIWFYWLKYNSIEKVDPIFMKLGADGAVGIQQGRKWSRDLKKIISGQTCQRRYSNPSSKN
jgi:hypothetical protein